MRRRRNVSLRLEELEPRLALNSYFVAPTGSDQAAGGTTTPWATLQHAANLVHPGDTVTVEPGTYQGFTESRDGTAAAPILFQAASTNPLDTRIEGIAAPPGTLTRAVQLEGAYVTLKGFTVQNALSDGVLLAAPHDGVLNSVLRNNGWGIAATNYGGEGVVTSGMANDASVQNNVIYSNREHGIYVAGGADRPVLVGNTVYGNGDASRSLGGNGIQVNADGVDWPTTGAVIEHNTVYGNVHMGFSFQGLQGSVVANNLVYGNGSSIAVGFNKGSVDDRFLDNTVVSATNGSAGLNKAVYIGGAGNDGPCTGNLLYDNVLVAMSGVPLVYDNGMAPGGSDYNLFWDGGTGIKVFWDDTNGTAPGGLAQWQAMGFDGHSQSANPLFAAPLSSNYQLQAGSPGINAGTAPIAGGVVFDPNAASYHLGYQVGAYGYQVPFQAAPILPWAVEQAPSAWRDSYQVGSTGTLTVSAAAGVFANDTDANGTTLTAILVSAPSKGTLTLNANGSFSYTANPGAGGSDSFTYKASDGTDFSYTVTVSLTLAPQSSSLSSTGSSA